MLSIILSSSSPRSRCRYPSPMQAQRTRKKTLKPYPRSLPIPEPTPVYVRTFSPSPPQTGSNLVPLFPLPLPLSSPCSLPPLSLSLRRPSRRASDAVLPPSKTGTVLCQGYVPLFQGPYPTSIGIIPLPLSPPPRSCSPRLPPPPHPSPSKSSWKRSCYTGRSPPLACRELSPWWDREGRGSNRIRYGGSTLPRLTLP